MAQEETGTRATLIGVRVPSWWPPKGSSRQFLYEKRFWAATLPPTIAWKIFLPALWNKWGVQYVAWLSVYALVKGAGGQEQAARAKEIAGGGDPENE